ncbi:putative reverse transcriptase domain-containing protein [Tanacetum coccineum]
MRGGSNKRVRKLPKMNNHLDILHLLELALPEGDHVNVSSYAGRTKSSLNEALKSVKTNVTSFGESTNPIWSTMNPSSVMNSDVEQNIWSSSVPTGLNIANTSAKGIFTIFEESTNPTLSMNVPAESFEAEDVVPVPTGWTSYDQPSTMEPNSETPIVKSVDINAKPTFYAGATSACTKDQTKVEANFRSLVADKVFDGVNIFIPRKVVEKVSVRFEYTLYGYFIGKRMAFPVVEYYTKNNWAKHCLKRIMMNAKGFFFFKFDTRASLEAVLEGEDGISLIATYLGKPIMMDSYTSAMCKDSWGRSSFARCLIKINSEADLKESITIGIPDLDGPGFTKETIRVVTTPVVNDTNVGFHQVVNKNRNNNRNLAGNKLPKDIPVVKGFQVGKDFAFQPRAPKAGSNSGGTRSKVSSKAGSSKNTKEGASLTENSTFTDRKKDKDVVVIGQMKMSNITTPNPFTVLGEDEEEEVENIWDESKNLNLQNTGASTPAYTVPNVYVCAILESHVDVAAVYDTCKKVYMRWKWTSYGSICPKGSRIILGWNDDLVDVMTMAQTNQVMHLQVNTRGDNKTLFCSFVYANNYYMDHRELSHNLVGHAGLMRNRPWVLMGDFNAALNLEDHSSGGYKPNVAMRDFKKCVQAMEVSDVNCTGLHFTWNQKPKGSNGILKKIDKIMSNLQFNDDFLRSFAIFQPYRISNHSPCVLRIPTEGFRKVVESGWNVNIESFAMYRVVKCLKGLKSPFCKLLHDHGNLHERVNRIRVELDEAQKAIDRDPSSSILYEEHAYYLLAFKEAQLDEEQFLKQKAKVPCAFVNHYDQFLGTEGVTNHLDDHDLYTLVLDTTKADFMVQDVTDIEVKNVIFSMRDDKAPGPDEGLGDIVSINQSAFVPGRRISNNILLTQELMRNYHRRRGPPRCAFKVDIQKAYDTDWKVRKPDEFQYHHHCEQQRIINMCFVNDLFLFARGHPNSISVIMDALEEFKQVLGLVPSIPKSTAFFCNVHNAIKATILNSMPFAEGALPLESIVNDWRNKFLSLAGRLQLIRPVLSSMYIYWASNFILLTRIVHDLEQLMHGFLWCQGEMKKGKAKVTLNSICVPKHEGGLDVCPLKDMLSNRDIARSGFSLDDSVSNLIFDDVWRWPPDWLSRFPSMAQLHVPLLLDDMDDVILWRDRDGVWRSF